MNMFYDEEQEVRNDKKAQIFKIPVSDFELSVRSRNCLAKMNIVTLGDLVMKTEAELLSYKNFGETSLNEIKQILESKGLRLGMRPEDDLQPPRRSSTPGSPASPGGPRGLRLPRRSLRRAPCEVGHRDGALRAFAQVSRQPQHQEHR